MANGIALVPVMTASQLEAEAKRKSDEENAQPLVQGLAAHVRSRWTEAKDAKRELEERMLSCLRQRKGDYDPDKLAEIKMQGGSEIYIQLTSVKCRAATSWLRDTLLGTGHDKPWALSPTPEPTLPPDAGEMIKQRLTDEVMQRLSMGGQMPDMQQLQGAVVGMKDKITRAMMQEARDRVERMERKMEDQLIEGGFIKALDQFLDDVATFPYGCIKGPVKRMRKELQWQNGQLNPVETVRNEWERVDPFDIYWAPWADRIDDGYVIERHRMTRESLESLIGVEGYSEAAIRTVLSDFESGWLTEWLWTDTAQADAEGKNITGTVHNTDLIDALQLWDSVQGRELLDWGIDAEEEIDPHLSYPCEVWLIGGTVVKAVLNYDPLGRKPYFTASYEMVPGTIAGNSVADLCRDTQDMVNAAARALANNMGISSGPQVGVNVSRLPAGEDITQMHPWKIWQFMNSDYNDGSAPIQFFQPQSNAGELMKVFETFSLRADEDTMIPKYMMGGHQAGAARTSSGLSMLISNAGKGIKQVINNIDTNIITPIIERLYQDNLRYAEDPDLVGDVQVVARGASSLVVKEMEATRKMEFLQLVLQSPIAQQIVGIPGAAELLRDMAENFDINTDKLVPDEQAAHTMEQQAQMIQQLQMQLQQVMQAVGAAQQQPKGQGTPPSPQMTRRLPDGSQEGGRESNFTSSRLRG